MSVQGTSASRGIDRRIIFLLVALALAAPLRFQLRLPPAQMKAAEDVFAQIDKLEHVPGKLVVIGADWGPGTSAENQPQTELVIEHLLRKRVPFALMSLYQLASPMLKEVPFQVAARVAKQTGESYEYGKDWVNLGYQVNGALALQGIARAENMQDVLKTDANGTPLSEIPVTKDLRKLSDVQMLVHLTGLVNVFNYWLQFFRNQNYIPPMLHGCTSISIPDAYMYYSSKQILGFFEGIAGAAWYDELMNAKYPGREEVATRVNTGLGVAQLLILGIVALGNIGQLLGRRRK